MAHKSRKRFGQNFLCDRAVIYAILATINASADQHWVEIGPGLGALTDLLLEKNGALDVIELDRDLVAVLDKKFGHIKNLTIHSADALRFDFSSLPKKNEKIRVIGNLPYNISTPLLFHLVAYAYCIEDMYFMLQKEVVDKICASPGSKKYGRLSVMLQYYCASEHLFDVSATSFEPMPKVNSALLKLTPHLQPPVDVGTISSLHKVVSTAFSQRRKTLKNSLKMLVSGDQLIAMNIDPTRRAESLSLAEFALISKNWAV